MHQDSELVIRRTSGIYVTVVLMSIMAGFGLLGFVASGDTGGRLLASAFVVFAAFFIYRALRLEVRAEEDGLYVRGAFRTVCYPWIELRGADVIPLSLLGRTWYLRVLRDGRTPLRLPDLSQFALRRNLDDAAISAMVRIIERRIRSVGGRPIE